MVFEACLIYQAALAKAFVASFDCQGMSFLFREFSALVEELVNLDEPCERGTQLPVAGIIDRLSIEKDNNIHVCWVR